MAEGALSRTAAPPPPVLREWVSPLVAEFIGTFTLIFAGVSAIVMTQGQNLVAIAFAHGLAIGLMVAAAGHISGGSYNPAVTIGLLIGNKIKVDKAIAYIVVELAGAAVAALIVKGVFPDAMTGLVKLGTPGVGDGFSTGRAFLSEIVLSFFLMYVIIWRRGRQAQHWRRGRAAGDRPDDHDGYLRKRRGWRRCDEPGATFRAGIGWQPLGRRLDLVHRADHRRRNRGGHSQFHLHGRIRERLAPANRSSFRAGVSLAVSRVRS